MTHAHMDVSTRTAARRGATLVAAALAAALVAPSAWATDATVAGLGVPAVQAERSLGDHALKTLDGRTMTLGALRGSVVVVNFWASWCPPCRRELPRLARLQSELAGAKVRVIAVSIDEDLANTRRFCLAQRVTLAVAHDGPDGLARLLDLRSVPLTLVLDRSGHVAYTTTRSDEKAIGEVAAAARRLIAEPVPTAEADAGGAR